MRKLDTNNNAIESKTEADSDRMCSKLLEYINCVLVESSDNMDCNRSTRSTPVADPVTSLPVISRQQGYESPLAKSSPTLSDRSPNFGPLQQSALSSLMLPPTHAEVALDSEEQNINDIYGFVRELATGQEAVVSEYCAKGTHHKYAVKTWNICDDQSVSHAEREISELKRVINYYLKRDIEGIVHCYETYESPIQYCLVMELIEGGTLHDLVTSNTTVPEAILKVKFKTIVQAVNQLHKDYLIHTDINLKNIMFTTNGEGEIESLSIIDVSSSTYLNPEHKLKKDIHRPTAQDTSPPEVINDHLFSTKSDVYSLGQVLSYVVTGSHTNTNGPKRDCTDDVQDLICLMTFEKYDERVSLEEALYHRWFQDT